MAAGFFGLFVYFVRNFAPASHASGYFWSHTVYFVTHLLAFNSVAYYSVDSECSIIVAVYLKFLNFRMLILN